MNAPVEYIANAIPYPEAHFVRLQRELDWERRSGAPRSEYYCNDLPVSYTYGRGAGQRTYEPRPWHPVIQQIRSVAETFAGVRFEVCFLNRYHTNRDQLGWHADDSPEMDDTRPIAVVSLGAVREIWFRPKGTGIAHEAIKLASGSLVLMAAGMQDEWEHRIPKASYLCEERISLTFRGYWAEAWNDSGR